MTNGNGDDDIRGLRERLGVSPKPPTETQSGQSPAARPEGAPASRPKTREVTSGTVGRSSAEAASDKADAETTAKPGQRGDATGRRGGDAAARGGGRADATGRTGGLRTGRSSSKGPPTIKGASPLGLPGGARPILAPSAARATGGGAGSLESGRAPIEDVAPTEDDVLSLSLTGAEEIELLEGEDLLEEVSIVSGDRLAPRPRVILRREQRVPTPAPRATEPALVEAARLELTRRFFLAEAVSLAEAQPEHAGLMWIEAAAAAERAGAEGPLVLSHLRAALELRPDSPWLVPLVRRAMLRLGEVDEAFELCEREAALGGEAQTRVAVLQEAAALLRYRRHDARSALALVERALELDPGSAPLLSSAAALHLELAHFEEAALRLEQFAEVLSSAEERALYLYQAGSVREARLSQRAQAEATYARAVEADPTNVPALLALVSLHERADAAAPTCLAVERLAAQVSDATLEGRLLLRAGALHVERTGDLEAAAKDLARATRTLPDDPAAVQRLTYVYEAKGRLGDQVAALRHLVGLVTDPQGRAALLTRIGWLLESRAHDVDGAIAAYGEALAAVPTYLPALQALGALHRFRGDWEALLAIHAPETEGTASAEARAVRCVELAEILTQRLARPEEALTYYRRALELHPTLHLAAWGLIRLLRELGRYDDLAELLEQRVELSTDPKSRHHLLLELAQLQAGPLQALDRAIETLERARGLEQTRTAALRLVPLYEKAGRAVDLVALLLAQADDTTDATEAQSRRLRAADLLEMVLEEPDRALRIYRDVLTQDPRNVAAIRAAGRIYYRLGRWQELIDLHRHELETDPDRRDAGAILCRIGRIYQEHLGQAPAAVEAYTRALAHDPGLMPALSAVEALVRSAGQWRELVEVLRRYAVASTDPLSAADALCRAAEVAELHLEDLTQATQLYREAAQRYPEMASPHQGLLRIYRRQERWDELAQHLVEQAARTRGTEERAHLQLELARVRELYLHEPPDLGLYSTVAQVLGSARLSADLTRVRRTLHADDLAAWLGALGRAANDDGLAVALLLEAAQLLEFGEGQPADALHAALAAHDRRPNDTATLWALERLLWRAGRHADLAAVLIDQATLELDPVVRTQRLVSAASAYVVAKQPEAAARVARECLRLDDQSVPALRLLAELAEEQSNWPELATVCDQLAKASASGENRTSCALRAADLWAERLGDTARALASLAQPLSEQPGHAEAFGRAERLLRLRQDYAELSRLYIRRIRATPEAGERAELLRLHARILRDDLDDPTRAINELIEYLALCPEDVGALSDLADLHCATQRWSDATVVLERLAKVATETHQRHTARLRQAEVWLRHLHDVKTARRVLEQAIEEQPQDLGAKRLMVELATVSGQWDEARALLEQVAADDDSSVQVWAMSQLAEVARSGLRDDDLRRQYETEALAQAAMQPAALAELLQAYRARDELSRIVELGESLLKNTTRPSVALPLRVVVARLLLEHTRQPARALEYLRETLHAEPHHEEAQLLYGQALAAQGESENAVAVFRKLLQRDPGRLEAYRGLVAAQNALGNAELAASAGSLLDFFGAAGPEEALHARSLEGAVLPPGALDVARIALPSELRAVREVLELLAPHLGPLYAPPAGRPLASTHPAVAAATRLATCLGVGPVAVSVGSGPGAAVTVGQQPVAVRLAPALVDAHSEPAYRFWVGRALASAATAGALLEQLRDPDLSTLLDAALNPRPDDEEVQQLRKQLHRHLPRKVRKQLEDTPRPGLTSGTWASYRAAERQRADLVGLLLCRSPKVAVEELARAAGLAAADVTQNPTLARLMLFAVSDDFARLYRGLWTTPAFA
ncbi:MAG: tetratricopeptide repeat protein [Deltaproteobacteria bacterium]|nr:tetratricopeptide repeat protein [Deltaproteobacteria bacterium]